MEPTSTSQPDRGVWPPPIHEETTVAADRWRLSSTPQGIACEWRPMPFRAWLPLIPVSATSVYEDYKLWIEDLTLSSGHIPNALMHANLTVLPWAVTTIALITFMCCWSHLVYNRNVSLFEYNTGYVIISGRWRYRLDESHGLLVKSWPLQRKYSIVFHLLRDRANPSQQMNWLAFLMLGTRFLAGLDNEKAALDVANYLSRATGVPVSRED